MPEPYRLFPTRLSFGVQVGAVTSVDIVELASGHEKRNARLSKPKANYLLPGTTRPVDEARGLLNFFHQQGGPLKPFLFDDPFDSSTASTGAPVTHLDVNIGVGDGINKLFDFVSLAGRNIRFPLIETLVVAVDGIALNANTFTIENHRLSLVQAPLSGAVVSFGCRYQVLVRFVDSEISITQISSKAAIHGDLRFKEVLA